MTIGQKISTPKPMRVLLVDDHILLLDALSEVLRAQQGIDVATTQTIPEAIEKIRETGAFDVVLLDYNLPETDFFDGMKLLIEANGCGVTVFSGVVNWPTVELAIANGASGFIPKSLPIKSFGNALRFVSSGETFVPSSYLMDPSSRGRNPADLKPRELLVLSLLGKGLPNKEIGLKLGLNESLVKLDVKSICRKLGARNRTEAVVFAQKIGLIALES